MKNLKIGLFGFGVVGEGIYQVLASKPQLGLEIKKIVIKDPSKSRNAPSFLFSTFADDILKDDQIDVVVELIDDAEASFEIVSKALKSGKNVVSGNKKMIASNLVELLELQKEHGTSFLYEAAVCGSIPILRNLEEYFDNDLLKYVKGIVNGSTNYILTQMSESNSSFAEALLNAQNCGFAESDSTMDVEGYDAAFKLQIITLHAFGLLIDLQQITRKGIHHLRKADFQYAKEKGFSIKLLAKSIVGDTEEQQEFSILPTFVDNKTQLASVKNEFNGVIIGSHLSDEQFFQGKGAGRFPTSSAVLSDLSALKYDYKYAYKKGFSRSEEVDEIGSRFFIGFDRSTEIKNEVFTEVEEQCIQADYQYIIGKIDTASPDWKAILQDKKYSVIAFEN